MKKLNKEGNKNERNVPCNIYCYCDVFDDMVFFAR